MIPYSLKMILTGYSEIIITQNDMDRAPMIPYSLKMILTGSSSTMFTKNDIERL